MTITIATPWLKEWVEALRLDPPKTTGALNRVEDGRPEDGETVGRCCLGVLLDVRRVPHVLEEGTTCVRYGVDDGRMDWISMPGHMWAESLLGTYDSGEHWLLDAYLHPLWVDHEGYSLPTGLATINDEFGLTHAQHADLIAYFGLVGGES